MMTSNRVLQLMNLTRQNTTGGKGQVSGFITNNASRDVDINQKSQLVVCDARMPARTNERSTKQQLGPDCCRGKLLAKSNKTSANMFLLQDILQHHLAKMIRARFDSSRNERIPCCH